MPKKTSTKVTTPASTHPETIGVRAIFLFFLIVVATLGLIFIWRQLPPRGSWTPIVVTSTDDGMPAAPTSTDGGADEKITQATCTAAGGRWNECGSPCRGQDGVCAQVCVPQCECGGIAGWQCPKTFECTDYLPSKETPDAMGVCKSPQIMDDPTAGGSFLAPEGMMCDDKGLICVSNSLKDSKVSNPFVVTGTAMYDSLITWDMWYPGNNNTGEVVMSGAVKPHRESDSGLYSFEITGFSLAGGNSYRILRMSQDDPMVEVGGTILFPAGETLVKFAVPFRPEVYFFQDVTSSQKEIKFISEKVVKTQTPIAASLAALVEWAKKEEYVPDFWQYYKVELKNGVACVHNDMEWYQAAGAIQDAMKPLIEATLKQFPSVKSIDCL